LKWGTPVPDTVKFGDKYKEKVMYNWLDAPFGYLSITEQAGLDWTSWWQDDGKDTDIVQFFGVDNTIFHTIIFPASLMGTGDKYRLVNNINAVYYLNYENKKFSKSEGVGVFGTGAIDSGIPSDVWRYYLLLQRPENHDTEFSWRDLEAKVNGELVNNLGNLIYRVTSFVSKRFNKSVPKLNKLAQIDNDFIDQVNNLGKQYLDAFDRISLKNGIETILEISHRANKYIVDTEPWSKLKTDPDRCSTIMHILSHLISYLSRLLEPYMPNTAIKINKMLNCNYPYNELILEVITGDMGDSIILFQKITSEQIEEFGLRFK
jgi:methionyl-tRNA synthetase